MFALNPHVFRSDYPRSRGKTPHARASCSNRQNHPPALMGKTQPQRACRIFWGYPPHCRTKPFSVSRSPTTGSEPRPTREEHRGVQPKPGVALRTTNPAKNNLDPQDRDIRRNSRGGPDCGDIALAQQGVLERAPSPRGKKDATGTAEDSVRTIPAQPRTHNLQTRLQTLPEKTPRKRGKRNV